jgi:hypothetical protein
MTKIKLVRADATLSTSDIRKLAEWCRNTLGFELMFLLDDPAICATIRRDSAEFGIALM